MVGHHKRRILTILVLLSLGMSTLMLDKFPKGMFFYLQSQGNGASNCKTTSAYWIHRIDKTVFKLVFTEMA